MQIAQQAAAVFARARSSTRPVQRTKFPPLQTERARNGQGAHLFLRVQRPVRGHVHQSQPAGATAQPAVIFHHPARVNDRVRAERRVFHHTAKARTNETVRTFARFDRMAVVRVLRRLLRVANALRRASARRRLPGIGEISVRVSAVHTDEIQPRRLVGNRRTDAYPASLLVGPVHLASGRSELSRVGLLLAEQAASVPHLLEQGQGRLRVRRPVHVQQQLEQPKWRRRQNQQRFERNQRRIGRADQIAHSAGRERRAAAKQTARQSHSTAELRLVDAHIDQLERYEKKTTLVQRTRRHKGIRGASGFHSTQQRLSVRKYQLSSASFVHTNDRHGQRRAQRDVSTRQRPHRQEQGSKSSQRERDRK